MLFGIAGAIPTLLGAVGIPITVLGYYQLYESLFKPLGGVMKPPVYLKSGDVVECEIEHISRLVNTVE